MRFKGSTIEMACVASICLILGMLEIEFSAMTRIAVFVSNGFPWARGILFIAGAAFWIGLSAYSLRRRVDLRREIETRKALQADLEVAQITDSMTGLPNRAGLEAYFQSRYAGLEPDDDLVLIGVCVSNLKMIADVQGFAASGAIAHSVSRRLLWNMSLPDFVACDNGQNFYLMLEDKTDILLDRSRFVIEHLIDTLRSIELANGANIPLCVHIGTIRLADCPRSATSQLSAEMLRRADLAVHEAVNRGSGSVVEFDAAMEQAVDLRAQIEASLDEAIRFGHILPHFQPLIHLSDNTITAFEVLARWTHAELGLIAPATFIPIAAESGRLEEITLSLLDRACRMALDWPGTFKLAFNVSPKTLNSERFLNQFMAALQETGFDPKRLEVEITEDAFVKDASMLFLPISRLKEAGISLSIDDFGTGYSSLRHLQIMPFDKIKIDQSFVKDMSKNPENTKIVEAIIGLGRSMGLLTVAEGIEGEDDRSRLQDLGCETGQGYFFAKAMPASAVPTFIRQHGRVEPKPRKIDRAA